MQSRAKVVVGAKHDDAFEGGVDQQCFRVTEFVRGQPPPPRERSLGVLRPERPRSPYYVAFSSSLPSDFVFPLAFGSRLGRGSCRSACLFGVGTASLSGTFRLASPRRTATCLAGPRPARWELGFSMISTTKVPFCGRQSPRPFRQKSCKFVHLVDFVPVQERGKEETEFRAPVLKDRARSHRPRTLHADSRTEAEVFVLPQHVHFL